ncbi:DUF5709 domain-containing protein [Pseudonocardia thermophila]|jgi:hypothetical protein|uniref:DUF5709 domain-containing protein n=1 Tax=Pseudonocardia thermophila TaxID=1848 RepID=UPI00248DC038|nr:DUF5709 domain-containing protein [Pseudonocardia thermophila]
MTDPDEGDDLDQLDQDAQFDPADTLVERGREGERFDVLDEGWSPPERPYAVDDWGTTAREEREGEPIEERLARELPDAAEEAGDRDVDPETGERLGDTDDTDGELLDDEVGEERSGRLAATGGAFVDDEELYARDEGISGGAASAEEAAVHTVREDAE